MRAPAPELEYIGPDGVPIGVIRRPPPPPERLWLHVGLFLLTLVSTTLVGGYAFAEFPEGFQPEGAVQVLLHPALISAGLHFSLPLLFILLVHEMGHYVACRAHRLDATLPFFIPVPIGIGTFGAFIRIRSPIASKRELVDVGAWGPLAGFVATLPVLVIGVSLSQPVVELPEAGYLVFGEPLLFKLAVAYLHPQIPEGGDLLLHPTGFAAWFGLFATALNLLPFGQLDGGHVTYALLGRTQRRLAWPLLLVLVVLGFQWPGWWLWAIIALVIGVRHPRIPDESSELDPRRKFLVWACIAVFALCLTPQPIRIVP